MLYDALKEKKLFRAGRLISLIVNINSSFPFPTDVTHFNCTKHYWVLDKIVDLLLEKKDFTQAFSYARRFYSKTTKRKIYRKINHAISNEVRSICCSHFHPNFEQAQQLLNQMTSTKIYNQSLSFFNQKKETYFRQKYRLI